MGLIYSNLAPDAPPLNTNDFYERRREYKAPTIHSVESYKAVDVEHTTSDAMYERVTKRFLVGTLLTTKVSGASLLFGCDYDENHVNKHIKWKTVQNKVKSAVNIADAELMSTVNSEFFTMNVLIKYRRMFDDVDIYSFYRLLSCQKRIQISNVLRDIPEEAIDIIYNSIYQKALDSK